MLYYQTYNRRAQRTLAIKSLLTPIYRRLITSIFHSNLKYIFYLQNKTKIRIQPNMSYQSPNLEFPVCTSVFPYPSSLTCLNSCKNCEPQISHSTRHESPRHRTRLFVTSSVHLTYFRRFSLILTPCQRYARRFQKSTSTREESRQSQGARASGVSLGEAFSDVRKELHRLGETAIPRAVSFLLFFRCCACP